jgi:hypothetical protein
VTHKQFLGIKDAPVAAAAPIIKCIVQSVSDFIKPLNTVLKIKKMTADQVVSKFDKDKSYLLSVKEMKPIFR